MYTYHHAAAVEGTDAGYLPACSCGWRSERTADVFGLALTLTLRQHLDTIPLCEQMTYTPEPIPA